MASCRRTGQLADDDEVSRHSFSQQLPGILCYMKSENGTNYTALICCGADPLVL